MKKTYVVAVAGGTCSGKSYVTTILDHIFSPLCRTKIINMDLYFKKEPPNTVAPITRKVYVEHNSPDTLELDRLFADFKRDSESGEFDLLVVEGLFALYMDEIRERADLKLFVDLASDARLVRRVKKFEQFGENFDEITERYIDTVRFRHNELIEPTRWHADVVLNGTIDNLKGAEVVTSYLKKQLALA